MHFYLIKSKNAYLSLHSKYEIMSQRYYTIFYAILTTQYFKQLEIDVLILRTIFTNRERRLTV